MINIVNLDEMIKRCLSEDIGTFDVTTESTISKDTVSEGNFIAKESGIVCGIEIAKRVFAVLDSEIIFDIKCNDGSAVEKGTSIASIKGRAAAILTGERLALNFLQHLSGIATYTSKCVAEVKGTKSKITDTRKTIPGLRVLEKYAVKCGGGANHRYSLSDGVLIKDNHIKAAGSITNAVNMVRQNIPHTLKIEVETENLDMVKEALSVGADIIMLDNMSLEEMKEAVAFINGRALTEASGNMGEKNLSEVAMAGVNFISIGALTHSAKALDISLRFR